MKPASCSTSSSSSRSCVPVVDYLDHQMINDLEPFTTINPSAENLAQSYFFENTANQLEEMTHGRVKVKDCTLYETDTSFARYYE